MHRGFVLMQKPKSIDRTRFLARFLLASLVGALCAQGQDDLSHARQALSGGETTEAIRLLETCRRTHPDQAEVYNLLGVAYGRTNDNERSLAMFKDYARLAPARPDAYNNLGAAYLQQGDDQHAETAFRQALRLSPQDLNALYNLGALLNARHEYSKARPLLERALARERTSAIAYEAAVAAAGTDDRGRALHILNSINTPTGQAAVPWLKLIGTLNLDAGNLADASQALDKAIAMAPDEDSLYALGLVRLRENEPERALPLLDKVFASLPAGTKYVREGTLLATYGADKQALSLFEKVAMQDPASYDALYNMSVLFLDKFKDAGSALQSAQKTLALKPSGEIHALLGDIYERQSHYREALNEYQAAVHIDPQNEKFLFDLGAELMLHENYEAAQQIFSSGVERFPHASRIYIGMGATEFMRGKTDDAVQSFLKAVNLDPQFEPAYIFLGEAFTFATVRSAEVIAKLAEMTQKKPDSFGVQYYYGAALVEEMQNTPNPATARKALSALHRAAALLPQDPRVYYQLGEVCRIQDHYAEAVSNYRRAVALDATYPEPLYKLGQMYVRLGKREEAKDVFARHREVMAKAEAGLYHRSSEIQSFVLKRRNAQ